VKGRYTFGLMQAPRRHSEDASGPTETGVRDGLVLAAGWTDDHLQRAIMTTLGQEPTVAVLVGLAGAQSETDTSTRALS
jgi:hypothetical protein